jgi:hypothetical protein
LKIVGEDDRVWAVFVTTWSWTRLGGVRRVGDVLSETGDRIVISLLGLAESGIG